MSKLLRGSDPQRTKDNDEDITSEGPQLLLRKATPRVWHLKVLIIEFG